MTDKRPDGTAREARRTLSEVDISSRRRTPRIPLVNSLGASGALASALVRAPEHDGAPSPDTGGIAAKPGRDGD